MKEKPTEAKIMVSESIIQSGDDTCLKDARQLGKLHFAVVFAAELYDVSPLRREGNAHSDSNKIENWLKKFNSSSHLLSHDLQRSFFSHLWTKTLSRRDGFDWVCLKMRMEDLVLN